MIVTEGVKEGFEKVKAWLIKMFNKMLTVIQNTIECSIFKFKETKMQSTNEDVKVVDVVKVNKLKASLLKLIARCKAGLSKSKALNAQNKELANKLKRDVEVITTEYTVILNEIDMPAEERKKLRDKFSEQVRNDHIFVHKNDSDIRLLFQKGNIYNNAAEYIGHV